jgi:hypothetical protein
MGGLSKGPIGSNYGQQSMSQAMQLAQFARQVRSDRADEEYRAARLAQFDLTERRAAAKEAREAGQASFIRDVETGAGVKTAEAPEVFPYFAKREALADPGATSTGLTPGGNLINRPYVRPEDLATATREGAAALKEATRKSAEGLPEGPMRDLTLGRVERGELRTPKAVLPGYEASIKAEKEASGLRVAQGTEDAFISKYKSEAEKAGYEATKAKVESVYAEPLAELERLERGAKVDQLKATTDKLQIELGQKPVTPGSPLATDIEYKQEQLNTQRATAKKAELELGQLRRYDAAKKIFEETGSQADLERAILEGSNGAIDLARMRQQGVQIDLERQKTILGSLDRTMKLKVQLQDLVNNKDLAGAEPIIKELNAQALMHSSISQSPVVNWTSIRQSEGWFPGKPITAEVKMRREEAMWLQNGLVRPDTPLPTPPNMPPGPVSSGLMLLIKANYGDLVNRADAGDPLAFKRLKEVANAYPGVSKEAAAEATNFIGQVEQKRLLQPPTSMELAPGSRVTVPPISAPTAPRPTETLVGPGAKSTETDPYAKTRKEFRGNVEEVLGKMTPEERQYDKRNAASIAKYRRPYSSLTPSQRAVIDTEVP